MGVRQYIIRNAVTAQRKPSKPDNAHPAARSCVRFTCLQALQVSTMAIPPARRANQGRGVSIGSPNMAASIMGLFLSCYLQDFGCSQSLAPVDPPEIQALLAPGLSRRLCSPYLQPPRRPVRLWQVIELVQVHAEQLRQRPV